MKYIQIIAALLIAGLLAGCAAGISPVAETTAPYQPQPNPNMWMCYDKAFSSVNAMMAEPGIILVRGTPVGVTLETEVGVVWTFEVAESSQAGLESVALIQQKDQYLLKTMEEVVLVLEYEPDSGRHHVIGGGYGSFYLDDNGNLSGLLVDSLLSDSNAVAVINDGSDSVMEAVYDILHSKF